MTDALTPQQCVSEFIKRVEGLLRPPTQNLLARILRTSSVPVFLPPVCHPHTLTMPGPPA